MEANGGGPLAPRVKNVEIVNFLSCMWIGRNVWGCEFGCEFAPKRPAVYNLLIGCIKARCHPAVTHWLKRVLKGPLLSPGKAPIRGAGDAAHAFC